MGMQEGFSEHDRPATFSALLSTVMSEFHVANTAVAFNFALSLTASPSDSTDQITDAKNQTTF